MKDFNTLRIETKGAPIRLPDGRIVHGVYEREFRDGDRFTIERVSFKTTPEQGFRMRAVAGVFLIADRTLADVVLWTTTAPTTNKVVYRSKKRRAAGMPRSTAVRFWNAWRERQGADENAWLRFSGLLIEEHDDHTLLRCSDGVGDFDPSDLVVALRWG